MADVVSAQRATIPLLTDDQVADFIINGYHVIEPAFTSQFHQQVYDDLQALPANPGDKINKSVPSLDEVYAILRWLAY
jgi:hypothetical protein|tara:strand:+ start:144 stop:377 length:234 start_codon:yes stop_codon:yes gene_type:complete